MLHDVIEAFSFMQLIYRCGLNSMNGFVRIGIILIGHVIPPNIKICATTSLLPLSILLLLL